MHSIPHNRSGTRRAPTSLVSMHIPPRKYSRSRGAVGIEWLRDRRRSKQSFFASEERTAADLPRRFSHVLSGVRIRHGAWRLLKISEIPSTKNLTAFSSFMDFRYRSAFDRVLKFYSNGTSPRYRKTSSLRSDRANFVEFKIKLLLIYH